MAGNRQAIQARIRSVRSTKKITKAMQMIANSKLSKQRKLMEANRTYAQELQGLVSEILRSGRDVESEFLKEHKSDAAFTVFFCSDLGLCGGYNSNVTKFALENLRKEDPILVVGTHSYSQMRREGFNIVNDEPISMDAMNESTLTKATNDAIRRYLNDEVGKAMASNPRTAIGLIDANHFVFVVSDGRTAESSGLSLYELAQFMQGLGVKTAYNLDGGGSSAMVFNGQVINNPTTSGRSIKERG